MRIELSCRAKWLSVCCGCPTVVVIFHRPGFVHRFDFAFLLVSLDRRCMEVRGVVGHVWVSCAFLVLGSLHRNSVLLVNHDNLCMEVGGFVGCVGVVCLLVLDFAVEILQSLVSVRGDLPLLIVVSFPSPVAVSRSPWRAVFVGAVAVGLLVRCRQLVMCACSEVW